ncbi:hypothetical protein H6CHR_03204 [Variovorax sp. PBL-H6]|uniref:hypothetical protein n=1 Tax=Variovorax sp. PBL-H6 TaxID=434009 RepID=UPI00131640C9|nr:hypothetical protein [Variovorax sp. PBL-H6]VTU29483.1 hypothetical protein H6CHR_03204 [Variovorax sp. PBL-H6]
MLPESQPLPGTVRSRINRIAHAAAQQHEMDLRARLLAELRLFAATGAKLVDMERRLDEIERAQS